MINDLIFASYGALIGIAGITVALYFTYLRGKWQGFKSFTEPMFEMALGVFGIALSTLMIRVWFQGWKSGEILGFDTRWMLNHEAVIVIILLPCLFYIWHIRTITRSEYGEKFWVLSLLFTILCFLLTLAMALHSRMVMNMIHWMGF